MNINPLQPQQASQAPGKTNYEPSYTAPPPSGDHGRQNRDANGIKLGSWESDLCGCCLHAVPNCWMVTCLPCISIAQVAHRLQLGQFKHVAGAFCVVYLIQLILSISFWKAAVTTEQEWVVNRDGTKTWTAKKSNPAADTFYWITSAIYVVAIWQLRTKVRERFQIPGSCCEDCCVSTWCTCCALAQLATHVQSYKPGSCDFGPVDTLPAFDGVAPGMGRDDQV